MRMVLHKLNFYCFGKTQVWTAAFLFLIDLLIVRGVRISPCDTDGVREILTDQDTVFNCTAEGRVQWRFAFSRSNRSTLVAICEQTCDEANDFNELFVTRIVRAKHSSSLTIRGANRSDIVQFMNGNLLCVSVAGTTQVASDRCRLGYVYAPDGVSCTAVNTSWSVTVSCLISSVYSSRGLYTCQLHRLKYGSISETLKAVKMVTSPTNASITKNEVKMSGFCQFNTTLPQAEGHYTFPVSISPGGRMYYPNVAVNYTWIIIERPSSPSVYCGPQPYLLENSNITCTCRTTSLGQPAGYLNLIVGNQTSQGTTTSQGQRNFTLQELHYSQILTLNDHGKTWIRCDAMWGQEEIRGENFTANVGYAAKAARLLLNGQEQNITVREGDQVYFSCDSEGRPKPNVSIYNNDNTTLIWRDSSPVHYNFIALCEDTATYSCLGWNQFSSQSGVRKSVSLNLDVLCKPRVRVSTHLWEYSIERSAEFHFDVITYPAPRDYHVWLLRRRVSNNESIENEVEVSAINITCLADRVHRYRSTCSLTVFNRTSLSRGLYKMQVINAVGDENFTIAISFDLDPYISAVTGSVVCVIVLIFTIITLITVIQKLKKSKESSLLYNVPSGTGIWSHLGYTF